MDQRNSRRNTTVPTNQKKQLLIGALCLLVCVSTWVAFSEASEHFFAEFKYDKPFFYTYCNISLLSIYLLGFVVQRTWRKQCIQCACDDYPGQYVMIAGTDTDDTEDDGFDAASNSLSDPIYVPANLPSESENEKESSKKKKQVKFNNLKEVRELEDGKYAHIARMSYLGSLRAKLFLKRSRNGNASIGHTAKLSIFMSLLFFSALYTYHQSLILGGENGLTNIALSFVVLFAMVLSAIFSTDIHDNFSFMKFFAACLCIGGVVLVSASSYPNMKFDKGVLLSFICAVSTSSFVVITKRLGGCNFNIFMFFGFMGFFVLVFYWPIIFALHYSHHEEFVPPNGEVIPYLVISSLLTTLFANVLWLYASFITSPFIASIAFVMVFPLRIMTKIMFNEIPLTWKFIAGSVPVYLMFIFTVQYESGYCIGNCRRSKRIVEDEMQMSLLNGHKSS